MFSSLTNKTFILAFVFCLDSTDGFLDANKHSCTLLQSQMCKYDVEYNTTTMPNYANHKSQQDAELEMHQFHPLVKIKCSAELLQLLCSVYFPECRLGDNVPHMIPPCRNTCQKAYEGCNPIMAKFGFSWPETLSCSRFQNGPHCPPMENLPSYIPVNVNLTVDLTVKYNASSIQYESCCKTYQSKAEFLDLDTLGDKFAKCADIRTDVIPSITWKTDGGNLNTLIMIDPDIAPPSGSRDYPFIHYQVLNIPDGRIQDGNQTLSYLGPVPPFGQAHTYYFLLYQQNGFIEPGISANYADRDCTGRKAGRCNYRINSLVADHGLQLVGIKKMNAHTDSYSRYVWTKLYGNSEADHCKNVPGYSNPCPKTYLPTFIFPPYFG